MGIQARLLTTLALLLPLASCILTPGKFASTLDIGKDRSFTFTYVGEVIAPPPDKSGSGGDSEIKVDLDEKQGEKPKPVAPKVENPRRPRQDGRPRRYAGQGAWLSLGQISGQLSFRHRLSGVGHARP